MIHMDQKSIKYNLDQRFGTNTWLWTVLDFKVEYKQGGDNKVVDTLSKQKKGNRCSYPHNQSVGSYKVEAY